VAQQGPIPPRSNRLSAPRNSPRWNDAEYTDDDEELPPWAGLAVDPRWADGRSRRQPSTRQPVAQRPPTRRPERPDGHPGAFRPDPTFTGDDPEFPDGPTAPPARPRGRQAAARARRTRRSVHLWGTVLVVAAAIGAGIWLLVSGNSGPARLPDAIVTTFQPGEFQTVPNACRAVTSTTLNQYLPGKRTVASPSSLDGGAASLCSWTLDAKPAYRLLNVQAQAYAPNGLASGDGSATFAAIDGYQQTLQQKTKPPRASHLPRATISPIHGLGSKAFAAFQQISSGGLTTDLVTVVVRDHNVLVTAVLQGDTGHGGYGPVSASQLRAGATAAARDVLAQLK
jgi:hypothetical protein